ncbi:MULTISPECIES: phage holin family protein [Clostridium]|uniref:Phage holin family protein n=1 Tax=Clostridium cibarium TaxID=2762247 RepID=A0ABR8PV67_9CLOT|nr:MULTISPECIES: phage holin family protein [Clostridium]MBD7912024.1 phage holin family protein [Clostridium cibarium]
MDFLSLIKDNLLELIPAVYILGLILKGTEKVPDKYIPVILLPIGIVGAFAFAGISAQSVVQGILITGAAVYVNQLFKQVKKNEN